MSYLNTLLRLKIFLISLTLIFSVVFILMIYQYLLDLSVLNILNIINLFLSILLPFLIGYYYSIYHDQKSAINELSKIVYKLLNDAKTLESISKDEEFFKKNQIMNYDIYLNENYLKREISMLYYLGIYFDNVKWYNHHLYNLPINFKKQINTICETYLEIDPLMGKYSYVSINVFIASMHAPYHYTYHNTNDILKEFFMLLISNYNGEYQKDFKDFIDDLNNVEIEEYYFNGKLCHT